MRTSPSAILIATLDVVLLNVAFLLSFELRFGRELLLPSHASNLVAFFNLMPLTAVLSVGVFYVTGLYSDWLSKGRGALIYNVSVAVITFAGMYAGLTFWTRQVAVPRTVVAMAVPIQLVVIAGYRLVVWTSYRRYQGRKRLVVVGETAELAEKLAWKFRISMAQEFEVCSAISLRDVAEHGALIDGADAIALCTRDGSRNDFLVRCANSGQQLLIVPELAEIAVSAATPRNVDDVLIFSMDPPTFSPGAELLKRLMDVVGSAILLLISLPFLLIACVAIRIESEGSPFFRQSRTGRGGTKFKVWKLRTMIANAEAATGPVLATASDPRITKVGAFLRASRLDELPQLINVLLGDMSLVGPRPERPLFVADFAERLPTYRFRHRVRPGVTGLAQVLGRYATTAEDKLRLDLMYIAHRSIVMDIRIMLQTVLVLFHPSQAEGMATVGSLPAAATPVAKEKHVSYAD